MSDWFFSAPSEPAHLRSVIESMRRRSRVSRSADRRAKTARAEIEDDVGFLALVLLSLIGSLVEKGVLAEDELVAHLERLDGLDGVGDGKLTPDLLRGALGLAPEKQQHAAAPTPAPKPKPRRR